MSEQFTVTIDKADVERRLGDLKAKAPQVIARGLNQTAKDARKRLADKAREAYTVKTAKFNSSMKIKNATAGNLVAIIRSAGSPLSLTSFSHRASRRSTASAQVVRGGGFKPLDKGGIKAWKGKNGLLWQRRTEARLPVKTLKSNSIPVMIGSEKHVYGIVEPHIQSDLQKNISTAIAKLVG